MVRAGRHNCAAAAERFAGIDDASRTAHDRFRSPFRLGDHGDTCPRRLARALFNKPPPTVLALPVCPTGSESTSPKLKDEAQISVITPSSGSPLSATTRVASRGELGHAGQVRKMPPVRDDRQHN